MSEQMQFWQGQQGDAYTARNAHGDVDARRHMFDRIMDTIHPVPKSILEVGANIGLNLQALRTLYATYGYNTPRLAAVEPNADALAKLQDSLSDVLLAHVDDTQLSTAEKLDWDDATFDMVFTCGVLIHIDPAWELLRSCQEIYRVSKRYIVCIEYFSDQPMMKTYHGEDNRLWTRDFGSFWMDNFKLKHKGHGFEWKRVTGLDNLTWWVFEK